MLLTVVPIHIYLFITEHFFLFLFVLFYNFRITKHTQVGRFTSMFSAVSKNVRKYAEVGYSRMGTIPSKPTDSELTQYYNSITVLCEFCQVVENFHIMIMKKKKKNYL